MTTGWEHAGLQSGEFPPGALIGAYRILQQIGSGGMGSVYLAERADGEFEQRVAIKFLRTGGLRELTGNRFLRERQLLASLQHSAIVHVLDAGHTADGQPFLVMEYVEGVPVDVYASRIPVRERLQLFLRVCEGVSHAHRRLIIHRDLKPANILVSANGHPKLLDFGIGKLLDDPGATQTIERHLTPTYASPEQRRGDAQTTATDIYSLGVVLYQLLSGSTPRGTTPEPPSKLNPDVPTDLDFIISKALRPEPEERYLSVDEFAADVRASLQWRPVRARSGDNWYRARRLLRRHWAAAAAAALALAGLASGIAIANRERVIAQQRFADVRQLANRLFEIDAEIRRIPGSTKTRQLIVTTALDHLERLAADANNDPALALDVGSAYWSVARVQGVPTSSNLGQMEQAEQNLQIARNLFENVVRRQPGNRRALLRLAQVAHDRMLIARFQKRAADALTLAQQSRGFLERFRPRESDKPDVYYILNVMINVADQFAISHRYDESLELCRRGIETAKLLHEPFYGGNFDWIMSSVLQSRGQLDQALEVARHSVELISSNQVPNPRALNINIALTTQAKVLAQDDAPSMGRYAEAAALLDRAFQNADRLSHTDPNDQQSRNYLADAGVNLGDALRHDDPRRALEIYDHTLTHLAEIKNNPAFRRFEACALINSSYALRELGRLADARSRLDAAGQRLRDLNLYPVPAIDLGSEAEDLLRAEADHQAAAGNVLRAIEQYRDLLRLTQASDLNPQTDLTAAVRLSTLLRSVGALEHRAGLTVDADASKQRDRALWQLWDRNLPNNAFVKGELAKQ